MMRLLVLAAALALLCAVPVFAVLPRAIVPEGWGVNIHFTDPQPGEMDRFREAGYRLARMDFFWGQVEKQRGVYDFSAYDRLVAELARAGARPLFILDYANPLYDAGVAPHTEAGRAAFARFAGAAAAHYRGRGVLWEIWNEPNLAQFWKPEPNAADYAALAIAAARAIHAADRQAPVLGPASSGFPWEFLETIFRSGLLAHLDAVSVHPYRGGNPETAAADYARLRALIARHSRRNLPIVSGEWGYSTAEGTGISEERQAQYLARQWLANLASGVNLSIFYDWRDDGDDPRENEHRFGTVRRDFAPKPAFSAAKRLIAALDGYVFRHRLRTGREQDWRLLFQRGADLAVVIWTTDEKAPAQDRTPAVLRIAPGTKGYETLRRAAAIRYAPGAVAVGTDGPGALALTVANGQGAAATVRLRIGETTRTLRVRPGAEARLSFALPAPSLRGADPASVPVEATWNGERLPELPAVPLVRTDPLLVTAAPRGNEIAVTLDNPARTAFRGAIRITGMDRDVSVPLRLEAGAERAEARLPSPGDARHAVEVVDERGQVVYRSEPRRYAALPGFPRTPGAPPAYRQILFVDNAAQPPQPLSVIAAAPPDAPAPTALVFPYRFDPGWRYAQAVPESATPIPAGAVALVVWLHADNSGDYLRARYRDKSGQTFQPDLGRLDWKGWRPVTIPLGGGNVAHWGGANDGVPQPPLAWDGLLLIDSANRETAHGGEIRIAAPTYVLAD